MKYFEWLDKVRFLNIRLWDFGFHSLFREYGRDFVTNVVLPHPLKTLSGIREYRKLIAQDDSADHLSGGGRERDGGAGG